MAKETIEYPQVIEVVYMTQKNKFLQLCTPRKATLQNVSKMKEFIDLANVEADKSLGLVYCICYKQEANSELKMLYNSVVDNTAQYVQQ